MLELTDESLRLIFNFVVPGLVAIKVFELCTPTAVKEPSRLVLDAVLFSLLNRILMGPVVTWTETASTGSWQSLVGQLLISFVSPALLALIGYYIRTRNFMNRWFDHPTPTAWDHIFGSRNESMIRVYLKSGEIAGGYYGPGSYSTSYPREPEVFVAQSWRLDERGQFQEPVPGGDGFLVRYSECKMLEFIKVRRKQQDVGRPEDS